MTAKKRFEISVILSLIFTMLLSFTSFTAHCNEIENGVLRLHILANSDSDKDQALKLAVRDSILLSSDEIFDNANNKTEALKNARMSLPKIISTAESTIKENGYNYSVTATVEKCYFDTRIYENFTLPAGYYDAVQVKIGKAEGKNWWCVLFPEVCISASANLDETLSDGSIKTVENAENYKVRFKVVELITKAREKINSWF